MHHKFTNMLKNLDGIRNIIFDFGGVIIDLDFSRTEKAFKKLSIPDFKGKMNQAVEGELFMDFEKGLISPNDFRNKLRYLAERNISDKEIDDAWNQLILDIPEKRINLLLKLREKYQLFLLSNSNIIHYEFYTNNLKKRHGFNSLDDLFDKTFFSFNLKMYKPGPEIYKTVIDKAGIKSEESLFIDDNVINLEGAQKLGIKTLHSPQDVEISEQLLDLI